MSKVDDAKYQEFMATIKGFIESCYQPPKEEEKSKRPNKYPKKEAKPVSLKKRGAIHHSISLLPDQHAYISHLARDIIELRSDRYRGLISRSSPSIFMNAFIEIFMKHCDQYLDRNHIHNEEDVRNRILFALNAGLLAIPVEG